MVVALVAEGLITIRYGYPAYHLYSQSFAGILAFEALTSDSALPLARSLTLSNVPSSVPVLLEDVERLLADLDGDTDRFAAVHMCRMSPRPPALLAAYAPGHPGIQWRGVGVIADWCANEQRLAFFNLPVLLVAGDHDFFTRRSMEGWQILNDVQCVVFAGASHHVLLELPEAYAACLERFLHSDYALHHS